MSDRHRYPGRKGLNRRGFLRGAGAGVLAVSTVGAAYARGLDSRALSFVHTHTGESLSSVYFEGERYVPSGLERINYLLRDFRTGDVHPIDPGVLDILFELHSLVGADTPYHVISGYRSPRTNAALRSRSSGVAEHSFHLQGRAIDVRLEGFPTHRLHDLARQMGRGGVGFYPRSDFVHLDSGPVRFW